MAKKKKKKKDKEENGNGRWHEGLKDETKHSIWAVLCLMASFFLILAIFGKAGMIGEYVHSGLEFLFGEALFLAPLLFFFAAVSLFTSFKPNILIASLIGGLLILISGLALTDIVFEEKSGGYIGFLAALPFLKLVDFWASLILFLAVFAVGFLIMFNIPISLKFISGIFRKKEPLLDKDEEASESLEEGLNELKEEDDNKEIQGVKNEDKRKPFFASEKEDPFLLDKNDKKYPARASNEKFQPPPLDMLETDKGKPSAGDIKANANVIKRTFQTFGIEVEMGEIRIGPSVTQYTLKPSEGIKLSRITSLNNDLSLALASHPIRIEAPIPGKSLVGIEVPNKDSSLVGLRYLLGEEIFQTSTNPLSLALGRNVAGKPVFSTMVKMPHLLIAGATGSGKSVAIHALMMSLLYRHSPADLQMLLIDPKRVELNIYNNLPHLLAPVITEAKKAIMALKWATKEMERRYEVLLQAGARDINSYHNKGKENGMPYIVIVIDELADIMVTYPREFEASIVRLAQMSRAVGIHLVVSTQRPSVEVITGLIKANITTRIAFQVASQVDSRTILDMAGAEKLLGNGDMLYLSGDTAKPRRIQGSFVSEKEVKKVVDYLSKQYEDVDLEEIHMSNGGEIQQSSIFDENTDNMSGDDEDELYEAAREIIIEAQKASSSYLQRRLRVGYARAARLLDVLEERGVVGPPDGSRPRDVLIRPSSEAENIY